MGDGPRGRAVDRGGRPAYAQGASDKAAAESLFDDGKRLYQEKKFAEALPRFEASERLDPGVGTLLYLADCYENLGRTASAWATFREAASVAKVAGKADRERVARERAALLDAKLYRLTVSVAPRAPRGSRSCATTPRCGARPSARGRR